MSSFNVGYAFGLNLSQLGLNLSQLGLNFSLF